MGIYLNPGNEMLRQDRNAEIFIDKSLLVTALNKRINSWEKFICVSRPRWFGKSMVTGLWRRTKYSCGGEVLIA